MSDASTQLAFFTFLLIASGDAIAACKLTQLAVLPVTMVDSKPMVSAKINGADALFLADSGAFFSMISPASAVQFKLKTAPAPYAIRVNGVGGEADVSVAIVKDFDLAGIPVKNLQFLVGGGESGGGGAGLVGQNVFRIADVEYDLGHGVIRLIREDDCKKSLLAYWAKQPDANPSAMDIEYTTPLSPHTTGAAYLNGVKIKVVFDTGASTSLLSMRAAERAGLRTAGPDAKELGYSMGLGRSGVKTWSVPVESFKIGDEEIRHTRLRVADIGNFDIGDMLLGADFFLAHRVFVATKQEKLFFTYNGGNVFKLNAAAAPAAAAAEAAATASPSMASSSPAVAAPGESDADKAKHAAEFSRSGAAFAARREFRRAIADLDRACALAPLEPNYFYERGVVKAESGNEDHDATAMVAAFSDFVEAIELQPDHVPALLARAELRLHGVGAEEAIGEQAGSAALPAPVSGVIADRRAAADRRAVADRRAALADLNAADRAAAKEADARLRMAVAYGEASDLQSMVTQLNLWIAAHRVDARLAGALSERCRAKAALSSDLRQALDDCNGAYRLLDKHSQIGAQTLDARAFVRLSLGDYDKSIDDLNKALSLRPHDACALYGRGIAKTRRGDRAAGSADVAAAESLAAAAGAEQPTQKCLIGLK